jgi:hypothetical protein
MLAGLLVVARILTILRPERRVENEGAEEDHDGDGSGTTHGGQLRDRQRTCQPRRNASGPVFTP